MCYFFFFFSILVVCVVYDVCTRPKVEDRYSVLDVENRTVFGALKAVITLLVYFPIGYGLWTFPAWALWIYFVFMLIFTLIHHFFLLRYLVYKQKKIWLIIAAVVYEVNANIIAALMLATLFSLFERLMQSPFNPLKLLANFIRYLVNNH